MAEYTDNYGLIEPTYAELADIDPLNGNFETIDEIMHASQVSLADAYDLTATYNTGDVVMYQYLMYKCKEDNVTGAWDATKWERTTAGANGSGGGGTEVVANPVGTPTEDLQTIEIAGTIYDIPGGGGSGGGGTSITTLYDTFINSVSEITLTNKIEDYDFIMVDFGFNGTDKAHNYMYIPAEDFPNKYPYVSNPNNTNPHILLNSYDNQYARMIMGSANNKLYIFQIGQTVGIYGIYGIKCGGGSDGNPSEFLPHSKKSNIICEATLDNFDAGALNWGDGDNPIILSQNVSKYNNEAVLIPVATNGTLAYVDILGNKNPFTAYIVCKAQTAGQYTRLLSALESHSYNQGPMVFGTNNINIGSWGNSTATGITATSDYVVCAIQYIGYGLGYCKVNGGNLSPFPITGSNRYITIGRTDTGNGGDQEPCDILVKYFGVVEGVDTHKTIIENVSNLMSKFGIS